MVDTSKVFLSKDKDRYTSEMTNESEYYPRQTILSYLLTGYGY